jgi:Mce-associated membrane protein
VRENDSPALPRTSGTSRRLTPGTSRAAALVLGLVTVLALAATVVQLVVVRPETQAAEQDARDRAAVVRAAEHFTVQVNNFSASDVDTLERDMAPLITTKFNESFQKTTDDLLRQVAQLDLTSEGEVIRSAVASIDSDSAEALVVADARATSDLGTRVRHFRWSVDLVKVDGTWLVDNFTPVA